MNKMNEEIRLVRMDVEYCKKKLDEPDLDAKDRVFYEAKKEELSNYLNNSLKGVIV